MNIKIIFFADKVLVKLANNFEKCKTPFPVKVSQNNLKTHYKLAHIPLT